jgi:hypothetical protein
VSAPATVELVVPDAATLADLTTYLSRARRVDPDGAVRLVASGATLAAYVSPVHGSGGPSVIGLRVLPLAQAADVDATVALSAMADRIARIASSSALTVPLPPTRVSDAGWAGISPPRSGWQVVAEVPEQLLGTTARDGIAEITAGAPEGSGSHAVSRLRALVWGRDVPGIDGLPAGAAFVADALGFVVAGRPMTLHARGAWRRLTSERGHVLCRPSLL